MAYQPAQEKLYLNQTEKEFFMQIKDVISGVNEAFTSLGSVTKMATSNLANAVNLLAEEIRNRDAKILSLEETNKALLSELSSLKKSPEIEEVPSEQ